MFAPKVSGTVPDFRLFWWWVGFCLHKPYPSSLHRRGFLHFRYLKFLMIFPTVEVFSKSKGFRKLLTTDFRLVLILDFNETHMCWGLNSHYFHVKGSSMVSFFHCSHILESFGFGASSRPSVVRRVPNSLRSWRCPTLLHP